MPWNLKRYYDTGGLHFITCSCYQRRPFLSTPGRRDLLLEVVERMRQRYWFAVVGYVVMPEHFHLLVSQPLTGNPSTVMQAIKLGFGQRLLQTRVPQPGCPISRAVLAREVGPLTSVAVSPTPHRFWTRRFYDFNVWSQRKEVEKLRYMHRNPVVRGLVERPKNWEWSSFNSYAVGKTGIVRIGDWSWWEATIRSKTS